MIALGVETSCDETSAAVVAERTVRANVISTQPVHGWYGGVVPELAARAHIRLILPVTRTALATAHQDLAGLDVVCATYAPGLVGALLVGLSFAKGLALALDRPFVGVHHLEGHIAALLLDDPELEAPFLAFVISGGHTELIEVAAPGRYRLLGSTLDDACGEAFDKVAKLLGLPYPGGPFLEELARTGRPVIAFPRPGAPGLDFSFSGLKTAILYYRQEHPATPRADIAASFQRVVVESLWGKLAAAVAATGLTRIGLAGGVAANQYLREYFGRQADKRGWRLFVPAPALCTDNAAMIAYAGIGRLRRYGPSPLTQAAEARVAL